MSILHNVKNDLAVVSPEEAKAFLAWTRERSKLAREDPLNYGFDPHPGQLEVHRATEKEVFLVAANRWGKSVTGIREVLWRATGTHPYKTIKPHRVIWAGFLDFKFYNKVTRRLFQEWHPRNRLIQWHETEKWASFKRADGGTCTVYFLSYESGRESWQGGAVDFIWLDEELPEDIYKEASARLIDTDGDMLMTQTPVSGLGWAYDEIFLPARAGKGDFRIVQGALAEKDESQPFGIGEPLVPHLSKDKILRFARRIKNPDERDIRIFGQFRGRSGGVYKMFSPEIHVVPPFPIPPYYEIWGAVDPGYHRFAAVIAAMDPMGRTYIVAEYFSQEENHTARARELWDLVQSSVPLEDGEYLPFYCDTANPQDVLELNTWAMQVGARISFASLNQGLKARESGIQRVQEVLAPSISRHTPDVVDRPRPAEGEPLMYFFDTLKSSWNVEEEGYETSRLIWEIQRYLWKKPSRNKTGPDGADDKSAGGADALSALRYLVMARMSAPPPPVEDELEMIADPMVRRHIRELEARMVREGRALTLD